MNDHPLSPHRATKKKPTGNVRLHILLQPLLCALALSVAGCSATYPINPPLAHADPASGYNLENSLKHSNGTSDVLLLLAFSGGGTRAAAFSYGVLKELSETQVGKGEDRHPLSAEIDAITAVSGGSFTAAYYGLYGDRIFDDYERVFLRRDVQGELTDQLLNPLNWPQIMSPFYTRADMATELYNDTIFNHATFKDLGDANGPFIIINATEMTLGTRFQFTQNYADIICTDLSQIPVARAVAASSAVPLLFSPITIVNRAGECDWQEPAWAQKALATENRSSRLYNLASSVTELDNRDEHPYLHLFDGGLADNLGLRAMLDGVLRNNGINETLQSLQMNDTRTVVVVLVNAETALDVESSRKMQTPSFAASLGAATSVPLQRYSFETVALLKDRLKEWEKDSYEAACGSAAKAQQTPSTDNGKDDCKGVDFHFIEVNFSEYPDARERDYLKQLPTSFSLTDEAVDHLIDAGRLVLRNNSEYQKLLADRQ
ncbi:MAG: patatin-like phospholipase family protein [Halioglobus sp.]